MVDLSYVNSVPTPTPEYSTIFLAGYAWELASKNIDGKPLSEILSEWMQNRLDGKKYLMSLMPKSYLVATSDTISFDDIFMITKEWNLDCFIGVFDESHNAMFVFNEEFGTVHVSFNPANVPTNASDVSGQFEKVLKKGFVNDCKASTGGNRERLEEYYQSVIEPYIRA